MPVPVGIPDHCAGAPAVPPALVPGLRWRRVFPGHERQLGALRRWLASLLPDCPARDDVACVATEYGANAVRHTASGRGGWFAVEITWYGPVLRVAVADGGAPAEPRVIDDPMGESGRGLVVVRALAVRTGVCGDHRGRLLWADIPWDGGGAPEPAAFRDPYEAAIRAGRDDLASRFAGVPTWFGRATLQWWALTGWDGLVTAPTARELADVLGRTLDAVTRQPPSGWDEARADATMAGAAQRGQRPGAPAVRFPLPDRRPRGCRDSRHSGQRAAQEKSARTGAVQAGLANVFAAGPGPSLAPTP
jgi:serine/threonine-protein kinase RsbW